MPIPRRLLRMTPEELDDFLVIQRTARVATVSKRGEPHVAPLWFVWLNGRLFVSSLRGSRRTSDLASGGSAAACVDAGDSYAELEGVVLYGSFRKAQPDELTGVREAFGDKYMSGNPMPDRPSHDWLVMTPDKIVSWDFRKIPTSRNRPVQ